MLDISQQRKMFCFCNLKHHILRGRVMPGKDGDAGWEKIIKVGTGHATNVGFYPNAIEIHWEVLSSKVTIADLHLKRSHCFLENKLEMDKNEFRKSIGSY